MIISTLLGAALPAVIEIGKQWASKKMGGVQPVSVDEQIKLDNSEIERIKALAELDKPIGQPSQWVVDLRASARYVGALVVISSGIGSLFVPGINPTVSLLALEAANIAFGFLFGSRIVTNFSSLRR